MKVVADDLTLKFAAVVEAVAMKPGTFVGRCSVHDVAIYLEGVCHGMMVVGGGENRLLGWFIWIQGRFLISHPAWHWSRILLHSFGSDAAALVALPVLYAEFTQRRAEIGVDGIQEEAARLLAASRTGFSEPETTTQFFGEEP